MIDFLKSKFLAFIGLFKIDFSKSIFSGTNLIKIVLCFLGFIFLTYQNPYRGLSIILLLIVVHLIGDTKFKTKYNTIQLSPGLLTILFIWPVTTIADIASTGSLNVLETPSKIIGGAITTITAVATLKGAGIDIFSWLPIGKIMGYVFAPITYIYSYVAGYFSILNSVKKNHDKLEEIEKKLDQVTEIQAAHLQIDGNTQKLLEYTSEGAAQVADQQDIANRALLAHTEVIETKLDNVISLLQDGEDAKVIDTIQAETNAVLLSNEYADNNEDTSLGENIRDKISEAKSEDAAMPNIVSNSNTSSSAVVTFPFPTLLQTSSNIVAASIGGGILTTSAILAGHHLGVPLLKNLNPIDALLCGIDNTAILAISGTIGMIGSSVSTAINKAIENSKLDDISDNNKENHVTLLDSDDEEININYPITNVKHAMLWLEKNHPQELRHFIRGNPEDEAALIKFVNERIIDETNFMPLISDNSTTNPTVGSILFSDVDEHANENLLTSYKEAKAWLEKNRPEDVDNFSNYSLEEVINLVNKAKASIENKSLLDNDNGEIDIDNIYPITTIEHAKTWIEKNNLPEAARFYINSYRGRDDALITFVNNWILRDKEESDRTTLIRDMYKTRSPFLSDVEEVVDNIDDIYPITKVEHAILWLEKNNPKEVRFYTGAYEADPDGLIRIVNGWIAEERDGDNNNVVWINSLGNSNAHTPVGSDSPFNSDKEDEEKISALPTEYDFDRNFSHNEKSLIKRK